MATFKFAENEIQWIIDGLDERMFIYGECLEVNVKDYIDENGGKWEFSGATGWGYGNKELMDKIIVKAKAIIEIAENSREIKDNLDKWEGMNKIKVRLEKRLEKLKNVKK